MNQIKSPEWVYEQLGSPSVIVIDCRFKLGSPEAGKLAYEEGHIPGAFYVDLEKDMTGTLSKHGGRHPLPDLGVFSLLLSELGIDNTVDVIAYDDQGGAMASRFWWMVRLLGHDRVYVMDGGMSAWGRAGYPVTKELPQAHARQFMPSVQRQMLASVHEVKKRLGEEDTVLVDSRELKRYLGIEEPIDKVAGHIPGAVNYSWKDGLDEHGLWMSAEQQKQRFEDIPSGQEIIVYCGSGVTACPNILALTEAGFDNVKLYSGGWSDWITYADNPIATGKE